MGTQPIAGGARGSGHDESAPRLVAVWDYCRPMGERCVKGSVLAT